MDFHHISMAFFYKKLAKFRSTGYKTLAGNIVVFRKICAEVERKLMKQFFKFIRRNST